MRKILINGKVYCEYENDNQTDDYLLSLSKRKSTIDWYRDGRGDIRDHKTQNLICKADEVTSIVDDNNSFSFSPPEPVIHNGITTGDEKRVVNEKEI